QAARDARANRPEDPAPSPLQSRARKREETGGGEEEVGSRKEGKEGGPGGDGRGDGASSRGRSRTALLFRRGERPHPEGLGSRKDYLRLTSRRPRRLPDPFPRPDGDRPLSHRPHAGADPAERDAPGAPEDREVLRRGPVQAGGRQAAVEETRSFARPAGCR